MELQNTNCYKRKDMLQSFEGACLGEHSLNVRNN